MSSDTRSVGFTARTKLSQTITRVFGGFHHSCLAPLFWGLGEKTIKARDGKARFSGNQEVKRENRTGEKKYPPAYDPNDQLTPKRFAISQDPITL